MIAYCGLDCAKCGAYLAKQANDDNKRAEVAKEWSVLFNHDIKPEQINCDGCCSDGQHFFYCSDMCEIRKCGIEKKVDNCAHCDEYACEKLEAFFKLAPQARDALEALRG
ncbi:MAG: DUF3795 domain-containing protein [candidate division Zixibacteria bacterium]|nr:DUF3795 domain-containing protein [candidate division Zixibacteria bacterium]